ncbi:family 78 glycoside hydrolase catalytic domain [Naasia sp. SYSU D00057]|uniref:family 78 glycoside hydrolase catalytic domain n=1 Tax=Naasia sp. SYSU D00057 TaxID=2817380 RepID=UPI001B307B97|nr:family 78 glycoside hydrolase catalytic domain [Naasia sp. SYSU D00057]
MNDVPSVRVQRVRAERRNDGAPVATPSPRLSWISETEVPGWIQASAEIERDGAIAEVEGDVSVFVAWPFAPLAPREEAVVRVRVTGGDGVTSEWSEPLTITAGHLAEGEWTAGFIGLADPERPAQPALLRREFEVRGGLRRAFAYSTAQGVHRLLLNGRQVGDAELGPGWTSYQFRLLYDVTDVTALLREGVNAVGAELAGGWYAEEYGFRDNVARFYGEHPSVAAQLVLEYEDGSVDTVVTDGEWTATGDGPRTASSIYQGESYDARLEKDGWAEPGFAEEWKPVRIDGVQVVPTPRAAEPVRRTEEVAVAEVLRSPSGAAILDFGQNLVGRLRIRVTGDAGTTLTLRHAEVLEHGELGIRPLRRAAATDTYTLSGRGEEVWEPEFTFHGFRYAQIDGWPGGEVDPAAVTAVVLHSDMRRTGWFDSSHPLVNRLHENVVWGMKGNFLSLPTDCPQRDERLGWTGDIQVFTPTASYLFDCDAFLSSWLEDLALEQAAQDGVVPFIVPSVLPTRASAAAAWGDAAAVVPTVLADRFADVRVLEDQYESMRAWADALLRLAGERMLWEGHFQFGDWLDPDAPPTRPGDAKTDDDIVASAYLHWSTHLVALAAERLGRAEDAARYGELAERVREAWVREYVTPTGRIVSDAPTAYALALQFDLVRDAERRTTIGDRLAFLVRAAGYHMSTGFVGTPLIQDALVGAGHADVAGRLLTQTENPSWLYAVTMGATTIWERWDSMLEDGSINPGEMTSFNHYAFGAVADWLHRSVGGLAPAAPGYQRIEVRPVLLDEIDWASTSHETPYGLASVEWRREGTTFTLDVVVPPNTTATVHLPGVDEAREVGSGRHTFTAEVPLPEKPTRKVSLDTPLKHVIDDREAYSAIVGAIADEDPEQAREYRRHTQWASHMPLGRSLFNLPTHVADAVERALADVRNGSQN